MRIAICDDVATDMVALRTTLDDYLKARKQVAEVVEFSRPGKLLEAVRQKPADVYLLDVLLEDKLTGIELARKLREEQGEVSIVFFSTSREYAVDAFAVEAISYLQKPWTRENFCRALDLATAAAVRQKEPWLSFRSGEGVVRFAASQIECVTTSATVNYVTVNAERGVQVAVRESVRSFLEHYGDDVPLIPAGRSILVNPRQIAELKGESVRFFGGRELSVPRSCLPTLTKAVLALSSPN